MYTSILALPVDLAGLAISKGLGDGGDEMSASSGRQFSNASEWHGIFKGGRRIFHLAGEDRDRNNTYRSLDPVSNLSSVGSNCVNRVCRIGRERQLPGMVQGKEGAPWMNRNLPQPPKRRCKVGYRRT